MSIKTVFISFAILVLVAIGFDDLCLWAKSLDGQTFIAAIIVVMAFIVFVGLTGANKK